MAEKEKQQKNMGLDLLRVFACLWVVAVHLEQNISMPAVLRTFCQRGSTGVDIFFVLTGFLAYKSLDSAKNMSGWNFRVVLQYWKKRAVRILPLYYALIIFYAIYFYFIGQVPQDETGLGWFRYLFLLNQWIPSQEVFWTNIGAVWTISVFAFFYMLVPLYYRIVHSYTVSLVGIGVLYIVSKMVDNYVPWMRPIRFMYLFAIGIAAYLAVKEKKEKSFVMLLCVGLLVMFTYNSGIALWPAFLVAIFIVVSEGMQIRNKIVVDIVRIGSEYSFAVYLVHAAVIEVMLNYRPQNDIIYLLIFIVCTALGSILGHCLIEKNIKKAVFKKDTK